ncbi:Cytochrome p450 [Lasiodiplodia theobromae]|uniref:Cytochrome P450 monooxygenase pyr3 n=1 Tax=Lasiodiplodia theobromae TaxID=45133 RepID=A0A5N5DEK1_9PEZI|nr:Cytochrome p450 [Lasiodiplodia theobromae]KAB2576303.1 Cytochrome P450 monooxygenase pyr3 [Lasiodiplodia theobromae]KAF4533952.1 Cytochrome p450 [Lasiodiplodia theobromae]
MTLSSSETDTAVSGIQHPVLVAVVVIIISTVFYNFATELVGPRAWSGFPIVGKEEGEWTNKAAQKRWFTQSRKLLKQGLDKFSGPFQIFNPSGALLVIPPKYADEIRNDERLSFNAFMEKTFFVEYSEFSAFHAVTQGEIMQETVRTKLTQALGHITNDLSKEMTEICNDLLPPNKEWRKTMFYGVATEIAARMSAKVFLGEPLCRNRSLVDISIAFTHDAFKAKMSLDRIPAPLRPFARYWLPEMARVRSIQKTMAQLIEPEIQARRARRAELEAAGKPVPKPADSLEWMDAVARGRPWDFANAQLLLNFNAIHTTSLTLTHLLFDLVADPACVDALRKEIVEVLREDGGWKKTSLYKMKLLDSCMKESQRINVQSALFMNRVATAPVKLSDGTIIPKGATTAVPTLHMLDDESRWGARPTEFDGHRFLRMREQPGNENRWQFVTTSAEHLGFGHGKHACPGRFFASNEIKIAVAHLLLKYDWQFENGGGRPKTVDDGSGQNLPDAKAAVQFRERTPEIDIDSL